MKTLTKLLIFCLIWGMIGTSFQSPVYAQAVAPVSTKEPVMKSVFWNTVMGSAWGAVVGASYALSDSKINFREALIFGTTFGGLIGYTFGVLLVVRGLSFDPSVIPGGPTTPFAAVPSPPLIPSFTLDEPQPFSIAQREAIQPMAQPNWQTTVFFTRF